jgi:hypothetical protein
MLLRRNLEPIGVRVQLSRPKRQSRDCAFSKFWISSSDWIVERSIIIESSEGWYLIRSEWLAIAMLDSNSRYFITYRSVRLHIKRTKL